MGRLEGKVAVVTGGGSGLGRAVSELYASEGAKVVVADIRPALGEESVASITAAGGDAIFVEADVTQTAQVRALVEATEAHYGRLDVMTANAGVLGKGAFIPLEELSDDEIDEIVGVNYLGVMHCFRFAIPAIRRAGGGAMTATTTIGAHRGKAEMPVYASSKGAVRLLVTSLGAALFPDIRVNAVAPGAMVTNLSRHMHEAKGLPMPDAPPSLARPGVTRADPRDVAKAHLFLVSDDASNVYGHTLVADNAQMLRGG
jgi:NAD(P)-dependent dehydrogenase (short-subunit alcohol dehydrogenase family)